jgi:hypothetical protein
LEYLFPILLALFLSRGAYLRQYARDKRQELIERLEPFGLIRGYVFDPALDSAMLEIRIRGKPYYEGVVVP